MIRNAEELEKLFNEWVGIKFDAKAVGKDILSHEITENWNIDRTANIDNGLALAIDIHNIYFTGCTIITCDEDGYFEIRFLCLLPKEEELKLVPVLTRTGVLQCDIVHVIEDCIRDEEYHEQRKDYSINGISDGDASSRSLMNSLVQGNDDLKYFAISELIPVMRDRDMGGHLLGRMWTASGERYKTMIKIHCKIGENYKTQMLIEI